ncbi:Crp/Fnr family transcriptional regulator [Virgibacillus sp. W0181]|uniref:Crp/Fnr family transcriptional regulator n=1 Tax=Virgibacillus sp. W0181 TaxID=3391581 RepID=UPI003F44A8E3
MTFIDELTSPWLDNLPYNWSVFDTEGKVIHFKKNNFVFNAGDDLDYVYIVLNGRVRTYLNTVNGKEKTLMVIGKNGLLGEDFIQGDHVHSTSAIAVTESTLLKVDKIKFRKITFSEEKTLTQWLQILSLKTKVLTQSHSNLAFNDTRERLASALIYLAKTYGGKDINNSTRIGIKFTHQELADFIGSSRVTVSNELNKLRKEGIVSKMDKHYHIQSISKLKEIYSSEE